MRMSKNNLKRRFRNLCLAIQICCLITGGGLDMAVICHADDGHVAIEPANAEGCTNAPINRHTDNHETGLSAKDDCGDCIDVPLSIGRATTLKKPLKPSAATVIAFAPPSNGASDATVHKLLPELLLPPPYFDPLSSIVLLI